MRLVEAILEENRRAGGRIADSRLGENFAESLPLIALTCIDPRLNKLLPDALGVPEEKFIWLRNAGNIITSPTSSTMRTLAVACVVKGGREIAIIGHTDCGVRKTTTMELMAGFARLGVERKALPDDLVGYFGLFASERQNVIKGVEFVRQSPLIGPAIPIHGLLIDIESGRLEWVVNGYDRAAPLSASAPAPVSAEEPPPPLKMAELQPSEPVTLGAQLSADLAKFVSDATVVEAEPPPLPKVRPTRQMREPGPYRPAPGRKPGESHR